MGDLRVSLSQTWELGQRDFSGEGNAWHSQVWLRSQFGQKLAKIEHDLQRYRKHLEAATLSDPRLGDRLQERRTMAELETALGHLKQHAWRRGSALRPVAGRASRARRSTRCMPRPATLQAKMHDRMRGFVDEASQKRISHLDCYRMDGDDRGRRSSCQSRSALFYDWLFRPLGMLLAGSRRIAQQDDFDHRIHLKNHDEMAELAAALNDMTARFQEIRNDLDAQVKQRTRRKSSAASSSPASDFWRPAWPTRSTTPWLRSPGAPNRSNRGCTRRCMSSLAKRLRKRQRRLLPTMLEILQKYLRRIQDEAFRCKGITEKLLDFSRLGDVEKQRHRTWASWCRA